MDGAVCIGGAVLDRKYRAHAPIVPRTSNPADGLRGFGGVARNVAENLARLGTRAGLVSIVGDDDTGRAMLAALHQAGVDVSRVITSTAKATAEYVAILSPENDLALGIADMGIFDLFTPDHLDRLWPYLDAAEWVLADCNLPHETLGRLISRARRNGFKLAIDAVSTLKAARLPDDLSGVDLLFMNLDEANALRGPHFADGRDAALALQATGAREAVVTLGAGGLALASIDGAFPFPAIQADVIDITGAGDALIAGTLHGLLRGRDTRAAIRTGMLLATLTTETAASVHPDLSASLLQANMHRIALEGHLA